MQENKPFSYQVQAKKTAKDSIFRDLFENPNYLLQLYQVLHPEDAEVTEEQISSVTIQNVLLDQMYNDLGFVVKERLLLLVEAQSTWSKNIVIRALLYLANTWKEYIQKNKLNIYGSRGMILPKPELYVIYTGERKERPEWISLSEEFFPGQDCFVDVRVRMLYDGKEGDILNQYVTFTKIYNEQVKQQGRTREAVLETIRICKDRKILKEYLESREKEVVDIMMTLFDQEYAVERYGDEKKAQGKAEGLAEGKAKGLAEGKAKGLAEGKAEGLAEGKAEGLAEGKAEGLAEGEAKGTMKAKQEMTYKLVDRRIPLETISDIVEISIEVIKKWLAERPVTVR